MGVALSRSLAGGAGPRVEGPLSSASCLPPRPPEVLLLQLHPRGQSAVPPGACPAGLLQAAEAQRTEKLPMGKNDLHQKRDRRHRTGEGKTINYLQKTPICSTIFFLYGLHFAFLDRLLFLGTC